MFSYDRRGRGKQEMKQDMEQATPFYSKRTHSIVREHILYQENTFYSERTHSIVWEWMKRDIKPFCSKMTHSVVREHIL